jgi:hypothetical protein
MYTYKCWKPGGWALNDYHLKAGKEAGPVLTLPMKFDGKKASALEPFLLMAEKGSSSWFFKAAYI